MQAAYVEYIFEHVYKRVACYSREPIASPQENARWGGFSGGSVQTEAPSASSSDDELLHLIGILCMVISTVQDFIYQHLPIQHVRRISIEINRGRRRS